MDRRRRFDSWPFSVGEDAVCSWDGDKGRLEVGGGEEGGSSDWGGGETGGRITVDCTMTDDLVILVFEM